jgi:hypothetical protein
MKDMTLRRPVNSKLPRAKTEPTKPHRFTKTRSPPPRPMSRVTANYGHFHSNKFPMEGRQILSTEALVRLFDEQIKFSRRRTQQQPSPAELRE